MKNFTLNKKADRRFSIPISWIVIGVMLFVIEGLKFFPAFVERYYSTGLYPFITGVLRVTFGWIPFSMGDLIGLVAISLLLIVVIMRLYALFRLKVGRRQFLVNSLLMGLKFTLSVYLVFNLLWGLNYYRMGSALQLGIHPGKYSLEQLANLNKVLALRLKQITAKKQTPFRFAEDPSQLAAQIHRQYQLAADSLPFLHQFSLSVKPQILGSWQGYTGYLGYINPFTHEAQLNFHQPLFAQPFTLAHEMAHQIGYATESEANLVAYLALKKAFQPELVYSAYEDLFGYAIAAYYQQDSSSARKILDALPAQVKKHRAEMTNFRNQFRNPLQDLLFSAYDLFLRSNNQPEGLKSYNKVVAWLVAYGEKYGWEKL